MRDSNPWLLTKGADTIVHPLGASNLQRPWGAMEELSSNILIRVVLSLLTSREYVTDLGFKNGLA